MNYSVLKGASYVLVNAPDMIYHCGTTQTVEKKLNPNSEYLKKVYDHVRPFEEVVNYMPNQVYIGNAHPQDLRDVAEPWYKNLKVESSRFGKKGEIMPQDEFYGLMKMADVFGLVLIENDFLASIKSKLEKHPIMNDTLLATLGEGSSIDDIEKEINENQADALYQDQKVIGCVKKAHDVDVNLNSHVMYENLVVKASGALALLNLLNKDNINPNDIDYVIEVSEEACGDMNQRGGGNFAKAIAEMCGCTNATGSDTRGFCAAPTHGLIQASSLVASGTYDNVVIVAGGATAKLGMNGKDHVNKDMPILEDVLGGFAVLISKNDGVSPILRNDIVGKHKVGTGSSPQQVMKALIADPLENKGLKLADVDKYSVEMQNPDITKPAGAGDVPTSNYKMIGALAVMSKELERSEIDAFMLKHGMPGWAPTQGHIPSGVPYLGFAIDDITAGNVNRAMIVGKGSLFLGRMTNLFDGVSIVVEKNTGEDEGNSVSKEEVKSMIAETLRDFATNLLKE